MSSQLQQRINGRRPGSRARKGNITALALACTPVLLAFAAYAVDTGLINVMKTNLQNAADAAALAAAQEILSSVRQAGQQQGQVNIDANSTAVANARSMAADVALRNGFTINPQSDVVFGKHVYDTTTATWSIHWNESPYSVVKVTVRRDNADLTAADARVKLLFGGFVGVPSVALSATAACVVEARDMVLVLDFSSSMNDDSQLGALGKLGRTAVEANIQEIFNALGPPNVGTMTFTPQYPTVVGKTAQNSSQANITVAFQVSSVYVTSTKTLTKVTLGFSDYSTQVFSSPTGSSGTFNVSSGNSSKTLNKCWVLSGAAKTGDDSTKGELFSDTNDAVRAAFGLTNLAYPYTAGSWDEYITFCRSNADTRNAGYKAKYGGLTFVQYLLESHEQHCDTADLWKTPHYPFRAMKDGCTQFLQFLTDLQLGDEVGLVDYATTATKETALNEDGYSIDLSHNPITSDYASINQIQRHKQAGHYSSTTNMGDGIKAAVEMWNGNARAGARPTLLVMTDGQANVYPSGWSLPAGWSWAALTDYDGNGSANYSTSDKSKQYAFYQAKLAIDAGFVIHTMSLGADADRDLMKAIAFAGSGIWIDAPGGSTIDELAQQLRDAFSQIAAKLPPPKLTQP